MKWQDADDRFWEPRPRCQRGAKEGLLGEGCQAACQASWVFTLQTASSQIGESVRKKNRERHWLKES